MANTLEAAQELILNGEAAQALPMISSAIKADPNNAQAHHLMAYALCGVGQMQLAVAHAQNAVKLNPSQTTYQIGLGETLLRANMPVEALGVLRAAAMRNPNSPEAQVALANTYYVMNDIPHACEAYCQVVSLAPDAVEIWLRYGIALEKNDRTDDARNAYSRAIELDEEFAEAHLRLANIFLTDGKLEKAKFHFDKCLQHVENEENPDLFKSAALLGLSLSHRLQQEYAKSADFAQQVLAIDEQNAEAHYAISTAIRNDEKQWDKTAALTHAQKALELRQNHSVYRVAVAEAMQANGQVFDAIEFLQRQLEAFPGDALAGAALGGMLLEAERDNEALGVFEALCDANPGNANLVIGKAIALGKLERDDESLAALQHAVELAPDSADARVRLGQRLLADYELDNADMHFDLALKLCDAGNVGPPETRLAAIIGKGLGAHHRNDSLGAIEFFRTGIKLSPNNYESHNNLALDLLRTGQSEEGWTEHEWRHKRDTSAVDFPGIPRWDGSPLNSKTILLRGERGYGDMIQFSRFAKSVAELGGNVVICVPSPLVNIMGTIKGVTDVITEGTPLPPVDVQAPMISLAGILNIDITNPPQLVPYLSAVSHRVEHWKSVMSTTRKGLRVGLVWAGHAKLKADKFRSIPPEIIAVLRNAPVGQWYALQSETPVPPILIWENMMDLGPHLDDFATTAAIMKNVDLVITVDTASAHLAGALGIPVWTIMRHSPCWRWGLDRTDSPWYPTMKLFRPAHPKDWSDVLGQITTELKTFRPK